MISTPPMRFVKKRLLNGSILVIFHIFICGCKDTKNIEIQNIV